MSSLNPNIFRAYDIRGKAGTDITPEGAQLIGQAFGTVLREKYATDHPRVVVGWDARTHSPELAEGTIAGLMAAGCHVLVMGRTPSPLNYFTIVRMGLDGGVQITASHNPKEDNGLKLQVRDAEAFSGEDLQDLRERIEAKTFAEGAGSRPSTRSGRPELVEGQEQIDAVTPYLDHLTEVFKGGAEGLSVVIDTGNGVAGPVYAEALKRAGATVTGLYLEPDGTFPNHAADPSKRGTLKELQKIVVERQAAIGLAFDGDGDRIGIVDEWGEIRSCDETLLLLAQEELKRVPGASIIFTVSMSSALETEIRKWGGKPVMVAVGHSVVEHAMREHKAPLGGEQSGHFFLEELAHGYDDALVAGLQVLKVLTASGKPFSQLLAAFPKVYLAPERRPRCPDEAKFGVVATVVEHFRKDYPIVTLDGARIDFGEGAWANIRASNTSPKLSVCMEARTPEKLAEIERIVTGELGQYPEIEWE
ncbi:MAG: phosphomannomutase/phosphoglucomutase [Patescibacteria group bacterium]